MDSQTLQALPPAPTAKDEVLIPNATLSEFVLEKARVWGRRRAVFEVTTGRELSYRELANSVQQIRAGLQAHGVRRQDVLALCLPNGIEFVLTWYAATSIGAVVLLIDPHWTGEEIRGQLRRDGAKWLVAQRSLIEQMLGVRCITGDAAIMISIGAPQTRIIPFDMVRAASYVRSGSPSETRISLACLAPAGRPVCQRA
ncbi:MAG TPA: class I adenylate-forming enzyme family protein [Xanthobacteraceae bacterium]|jgi:acyl-CoA synthetase (AMP-forming)/AMP-acid ligase II